METSGFSLARAKAVAVFILALAANTGLFQVAFAGDAGNDIRLSEALGLANAALAACRAQGHPASVSVVGADGITRLTLRDDGAVKQPVAAPIKAFTALTFHASGADIAAREKSDPAFAARITSHPDIYNDHPGSIPLYHNGVLIGALAVADVDHEVADACARAAAEQFPLK